MIDGQDILKMLREYEVEPPPVLRTNIFSQLDPDFKKNADADRRGLFDQLQELEIKPPAFVYPAVEKRVMSDLHLSFLQHLETPPPVNAYNTIIEKIAGAGHQPTRRGITGIRKIYRLSVAAAILVVALIGWWLYRVANSPAKQPVEVAAKKTAPVNHKNDPIIRPEPVTPGSKNLIAALSLKHKKRKPFAINDKPAAITMSVDDYKFPVVDNDLLFTFASFTYTALPTFVTDVDKKEFSIRIDQYAAINVSERMTKMIRRMNVFRKNGKLTNRAKRSRATQEKWKKADTEQFDNSLIKNPFDPVDLAEFIFK